MKLSVLIWALCHEDMWWSGGIAPPFLTSALDRGEHLHAPADLPPGRRAPESVWTLWRREKSCYAGKRTRAAQPVDHCYIHWATPTPFYVARIFCSSRRPNRLRGQLIILSARWLVPRSRKLGSIHTPSWHSALLVNVLSVTVQYGMIAWRWIDTS
jgi:hypothetical protein